MTVPIAGSQAGEISGVGMGEQSGGGANQRSRTTSHQGGEPRAKQPAGRHTGGKFLGENHPEQEPEWGPGWCLDLWLLQPAGEHRLSFPGEEVELGAGKWVFWPKPSCLPHQREEIHRDIWAAAVLRAGGVI